MAVDPVFRIAVVATSNGPENERRLTDAGIMRVQVSEAFARLGLHTVAVENANQERTVAALQGAVGLASSEQTVTLVIYLGGHGVFSGADIHILAADGSHISLASVLRCADESARPVEEVVVFLDACNSGDGVAIAEHVSTLWERIRRDRRLVLIPSAPPGSVAFQGKFSAALATSINILTRADRSQLHISPRQLLNVIGKVEPTLSQLDLFTDRAVEDVEYVALPNPVWDSETVLAQAEESDSSWCFIDRPLLRGDIREALAHDENAADGRPTVLSGPAGGGKSTILRWIAKGDHSTGKDRRTIYIDCRGRRLEQIQDQLWRRLGFPPRAPYDPEQFAREIAGLCARVIFDEADDSPATATFIRALAEIGGARVVVAHSSPKPRHSRSIDLAHEKYSEESKSARLQLARHVLAGANLATDDGFVESLVDAAEESFLMVYLLARAGASELPAQARSGGGIAEALAGVFARGVRERLMDAGWHPADLSGRLHEVLLVLAIAEGDGMPSARLWADVAQVPALETDGLRSALLVSIGPLLETIEGIEPSGRPHSSWRLQPTAIVAALRLNDTRMQSRFADRLLEELDKPFADQDRRIAAYAQSHLPEHLRRANRLRTLLGRPEILEEVDRQALLRALALGRDSDVLALHAIVRAAGDADLLPAIALIGGSFGLPSLADRCRQSGTLSVAARWIGAASNSYVFGARGQLVIGKDSSDRLPPSPEPPGVTMLDLNGRGISAFCCDREGRAWASAHDGVVTSVKLGWGGEVELQDLFDMRGMVHTLFERDGWLTAASAQYVVCVRVENREEREVLNYPAVLGAVAFACGEGAVVQPTELVWRSDGREFSKRVPAGRRTFIAMDAAGEWVFASTEDGSVWASARNATDFVPVVGHGGGSRFDALEVAGEALVVTASQNGRVIVWEMSTVPHRRWSFEFPLEVADIALLTPDECAISTGRGVVRVKNAESKREGDR